MLIDPSDITYVGMDAAKKFFSKIAKSVSYVEQGGNVKLLATSLNMVITGNPGIPRKGCEV